MFAGAYVVYVLFNVSVRGGMYYVCVILVFVFFVLFCIFCVSMFVCDMPDVCTRSHLNLENLPRLRPELLYSKNLGEGVQRRVSHNQARCQNIPKREVLGEHWLATKICQMSPQSIISLGLTDQRSINPHIFS